MARSQLPPNVRGGVLSRRRFFELAAGAAAVVAAPPLLGGCGGSRPAAAPPAAQPAAGPAAARPPQRGGTLRVAFAGSAQRLDPATMTLNEEYNVTLAIYNNLVRVDPQLQVQPELATGWQASDDLKTWTFQLRENVAFHHGKRFDAGDVVFSFERLLDEQTASPARSILGFVEGVEKTGDRSVVFHLRQGNADLPTILGFAQGRILPADRSPDQIAQEPSGTGPFKLKARVPGEYVSLVRNEAYWEPGLPYLDEVRHVTLPEQASQVAALSGGTIDMIWQLNLEAMPTLEADPNVAVLMVESGGYQPIVMRCDRPPFDDNRLRLAMKYVVDRSQLQQAVLLGKGSLGADQPIPPINPLYTDQAMRGRDIAKAKQLLAEAGHADGIDLTLYTTPGRPGLVEQAVAFKEMAAPAGIRIDVQKIPNNVYWADYWMKKDLVIGNWNFRPTADETLAVGYHSAAKWNEGFWFNPVMDDLIVTARAEADTAKRRELYARAAKLLMDEGPSVIAFFRPMVSAARRKVQGFQVHPATWLDVRSTWLEG